MTVFNLLAHYLWQKTAKYALRLFGWSVVAELPPVQKYLMIGAHHTSNWDLPILLLMMAALGLKFHWIGKDSLFKGPQGWLMRWLGGIPVQRGARKNFVAQIIDLYNDSTRKDMVITISPEGTRRSVDHWKTGFYHIATGAQIPVAMCFLDYSRKTCGIGGYFYLTGDVEADLAVLKDFYADKVGKFPCRQGTIRFLPKNTK
ncbi:MAG: lysophospholipid acyltransferase family protein [Anaerolineales bacterium]|nr:lysophospholipid acyltransferase family protein [Anaerolineales bacterium]